MNIHFDRKWVIPTAVGVVSFGAGAATGYVICAARFHKRVQEIEFLGEKLEEFALQSEINLQNRLDWEAQQREDREDAPFVVDPGQESFSLDTAEQDYLNPVIDEEKPIIMDQTTEGGYHTHTITPEELPKLNHSMTSIFPDREAEEDGWDYAVEMENRKQNPGLPYIIHRDEFMDNEGGHVQRTITYYEGDDILADDGDIPIYQPSTIVGNIEFGKGSQDPNVCYVRNEKLNAEYEILRHHGRFTVEVLGEEIEHFFEKGDLKKVPKFREE